MSVRENVFGVEVSDVNDQDKRWPVLGLGNSWSCAKTDLAGGIPPLTRAVIRHRRVAWRLERWDLVCTL
jgi:hypothetical protein